MHYFEPRPSLGVGDVQRVDLQPKALVLQVVQAMESARVHRHRVEVYDCALCGAQVDNSILVYRDATFPASVLHDVVWHGAWPEAMDRFVHEVVLRGDSMVTPTTKSHDEAESHDPGSFDPWSAILPKKRLLSSSEVIEAEEGVGDVLPGSKIVDATKEGVVEEVGSMVDPGEDGQDVVVDDDGDKGLERVEDGQAEDADPWEVVVSSVASSLRRVQPSRRAVVDPFASTTRRVRGASRVSSSLPVAPSIQQSTVRSSPRAHSHEPSRVTALAPASVPGHALPVEAQICRAYPVVSPSLARAIVSTAHQVGADPRDLANIIAFESNLTFSPQVRNPRTGAVGLIQFDAVQTPTDLGISVDELLSMDPVTQMDWVGLKLDRARAGMPLRRPYQVGMAVFFPPAIGYPDSVPFPPEVVAHNAGILSPRDYMIRVGRVAKLEGSEPFPVGEVSPASVQVSHGPSAQDEGGLLGSVTGWFQSLLGGGETPGPSTSTSSSGRPMAKVVVEPGIVLRFTDEGGIPWGEGAIPPGLYTVLAWIDQRWLAMGKTVFEAGVVYRAIRKEDGRLHILGPGT